MKKTSPKKKILTLSLFAVLTIVLVLIPIYNSFGQVGPSAATTITVGTKSLPAGLNVGWPINTAYGNPKTNVTPPNSSNWKTEVSHNCPNSNACGFGNAMTIGAWGIDQEICNNAKATAITVRWATVRDFPANSGGTDDGTKEGKADSDGFMGVLFIADSNNPRLKNLTPAGNASIVNNDPSFQNKVAILGASSGNGAASSTSELTAGGGSQTLGYNADLDNFTKNELDFLRIGMIRDQSAGNYANVNGNPVFELKKLTTTPPVVRITFDRDPDCDTVDPTGPSCDNPITFSPPSLSAPGPVTVFWRSYNNDSGIITDNGPGADLIGPLGPTNRLLGSQLVTVSGTTTFTGTWSRTGFPDAVCQGTIVVAPPATRKPILRVTGGDVHAGAVLSLSDGASCDTNVPGRDIRTRDGSAAGSTGEYAVSATGNITGFVGDRKSGGSTDLSFNNDSVPAGRYDVICREDLSAVTDGETLVTNPAITGGVSGSLPQPNGNKQVVRYSGPSQFTIPSGLTIQDGNLSTRQRLLVIVEGDVKINGNIVYDSGYDTKDEIPSFGLVATGSIFVDPSVTRLDGLYVANGSNGADAGFSTCSNNFTFTSPALSNTTCAQPLTINGVLVARKVHFRRTAGDVGGVVAEEIKFLPELYLVNPPTSTNIINLTKDEYLDLPPVF